MLYEGKAALHCNIVQWYIAAPQGAERTSKDVDLGAVTRCTLTLTNGSDSERG